MTSILRVGRDVVHVEGDNGGLAFLWNSRWHRKGRSSPAPQARRQRLLARSTAVLFAAGSLGFLMAGAVVAVGAEGDDVWNLLGSVLFSVGAVAAWGEAIGAARLMPAAWRHGEAVWGTAAGRAGFIQLVSAAVVFQVSTIADVLGAAGGGAILWIWIPSVIGSIGFCWAGVIYLREALPARDVGTANASLNLTGSVLFLGASIFGLLDPDRTREWTETSVTVGFSVGSFGFLVGAVLAMIELHRPLPKGAMVCPLCPSLGRPVPA